MKRLTPQDWTDIVESLVGFALAGVGLLVTWQYIASGGCH